MFVLYFSFFFKKNFSSSFFLSFFENRSMMLRESEREREWRGQMSSSEAATTKPRVMIVPGNGCRNVRDANWYAWMEDQLIKSGLFSQVILQDMPDPYVAKESIWIPCIREQLTGGRSDDDPELNNTIIIGHSSGAEAAMRYLERWPLRGCVLVCACHTDLGCKNEKKSGYYSRPWPWDVIKSNAGWILQFHSKDDPFIPQEEADFVASHLSSEYHLFENRSHFFDSSDLEFVLPLIRKKLCN